jgi:hypothetical protein
MGWGGAAGGGSAGIPTGPASPEVAWATDEDRHREGGPRDDDPDPRPGCVRDLLVLSGWSTLTNALEQ